MLVQSILKSKPTAGVVTIRPDASISDAAIYIALDVSGSMSGTRMAATGPPVCLPQSTRATSGEA